MNPFSGIDKHLIGKYPLIMDPRLVENCLEANNPLGAPEDILESTGQGLITAVRIDGQIPYDIITEKAQLVGGIATKYSTTKDFPNAIPPFKDTLVAYKGAARAFILVFWNNKHRVATMYSIVLREKELYIIGAMGYGCDETGEVQSYKHILWDKSWLEIVEHKRVITSGALTAMATFSMANCKNVILTAKRTTEITKKKSGNKKIIKLPYRFYVLQIKPFKVKYTEKDSIEAREKRTAKHLRRGHFKDFRDGPGLFGKYKGIYWWEHHWAGDLEHGVVDKDYEISS